MFATVVIPSAFSTCHHLRLEPVCRTHSRPCPVLRRELYAIHGGYQEKESQSGAGPWSQLERQVDGRLRFSGGRLRGEGEPSLPLLEGWDFDEVILIRELIQKEKAACYILSSHFILEEVINFISSDS